MIPMQKMSMMKSISDGVTRKKLIQEATMSIQTIKSKIDGSVIFMRESPSICLAIRDAVKEGVSLRNANLDYLDLSCRVLARADFEDASINGTNFAGSDISNSSFRGCDFKDTIIKYADFTGVDLCNAEIPLKVLRQANLTSIRDDIWAVLCASPHEAYAIREALMEGRVDGWAYTGECACLIGTIANARHCDFEEIPGLIPDSYRPAESFFYAIKPGDTPRNSPFAKLVIEWIDQWHANLSGAFNCQKWPKTKASRK